MDQHLFGGCAGIVLVFGDVDIALNREGEIIPGQPVLGAGLFVQTSGGTNDRLGSDGRRCQRFGAIVDHSLAHLGGIADGECANAVLDRCDGQGGIADLNMVALIINDPAIDALFDAIPDFQPAHQTVVDLKTEFLEFARLVPGAEPQNQTAFRQLIGQADVLDQAQGFIKRHHHHRGPQFDALGHARHMRGRHQR